MTRCLVTLLLALSPLASHAQSIYKCLDANGRAVLSNIRLHKDCRLAASERRQAPPAAAPAARPRPATATPSPAAFPRIDAATQRARDTDRRRILELELDAERQSLSEVRRQFPGSTSGTAALPPAAAEKMARHERNIRAIERELDGLR